MTRVVVGVDGSPNAERALRWAVEEAARRNAVLVAVHAYHPAKAADGEVLAADADVRAEAQAMLDATVDASLYGVADAPEVERRVRVVRDSAARALIEEARDADLLVIGSRGLDGFVGLLAGSVSQQCTTHAPCPTVVVPQARTESVGAAVAAA